LTSFGNDDFAIKVNKTVYSTVNYLSNNFTVFDKKLKKNISEPVTRLISLICCVNYAYTRFGVVYVANNCNDCSVKIMRNVMFCF